MTLDLLKLTAERAPEAGGTSAAAGVEPLLRELFRDGLPVRFEFWDDSGVGPADGPGTLQVRSPNAIRRMLWGPGEMGIARAYVTGELQTDGDIICVLRALADAAPPDVRAGARLSVRALR